MELQLTDCKARLKDVPAGNNTVWGLYRNCSSCRRGLRSTLPWLLVAFGWQLSFGCQHNPHSGAGLKWESCTWRWNLCSKERQRHGCGSRVIRKEVAVSYAKEQMALTGEVASELSFPSVSSLSFLTVYCPINEPSSLNCPSPPSPQSTRLSSLSCCFMVPSIDVWLPCSGLLSSSLKKEKKNIT